MNKKDYYLVSLIGFLVGLLVLLPLANLGIKINFFVGLISVFGFTLFAPLALWLLKVLSHFFPILEQFSKFAAVGTLNTLLDLGILNLLIFLSGIASGVFYAVFKAISFLVATTNSYFWNKFWTFQSRLPVTVGEYVRFALFTLVGALINVSVASLIVNVVGHPANWSPKLWANVGALVAVAASFLWNFLSYKNIVFKSKINPSAGGQNSSS